MQADYLTGDIYLLVPRLGCLPFDHQDPYEVVLVDRAAKKLSPLMDPVTRHHVLNNIHVRYIYVLDPVFSIRSEEQIDSVTPDSFM